MSASDALWEAVPTRFKENDLLLVAGMLLGLYLLYTLVSAYLAFMSGATMFNAVANTLRQLTFFIAAYAMLALALNLHWGYTGLFNIGIAGFMAVGVYTMAILAAPPTGSPPGLGLPLPLAVVGGVIAAALVGGLTALPALQLDADYLAIVTVGISEIIRLTLNASYFAGTVSDPSNSGYNVVELFGFTFGTGGGQGINTGLNQPMSFLFDGPLSFIGQPMLETAQAFGITQSVATGATYALVLLLVFVTLYYVLLSRIGNSPFGRVLKAIREDELVASSLGKDTRLFKIKVFMVGCGLMGLGGILWQGSYGYVTPNTFRPILTFYIFTALIVGGAGSNTGSIIGGAVFFSLLLEGPRRLANVVQVTVELFTGPIPAPSNFVVAVTSLNPLAWLGYAVDNVAYLKFIFLGAVLVYMMQNRPEGLLGHRKETASSVDLSRRPREPANAPVADGGETDE